MPHSQQYQNQLVKQNKKLIEICEGVAMNVILPLWNHSSPQLSIVNLIEGKKIYPIIPWLVCKSDLLGINFVAYKIIKQALLCKFSGLTHISAILDFCFLSGGSTDRDEG